MKRDDSDAKRLMVRQFGVLARAQAPALGISAGALRHRIRPGGPWQRVLPGVYLTVTGTPTADQRDMAALLYAGKGSVLTGAAALRRFELRAPGTEAVDVLVPAARQPGNCEYVVIHRTNRLPERVAYTAAIQYASPARAVADAVRGMGQLADIRAVVADAVQQRWCTVDQLAAELSEGPMRGSAGLRSVLAEVAAGTRSSPEGSLLDLIKREQLPMPMLNPWLYLGGRFLAQPDAWWPEASVIVEVDSREWHLSPEDWEATMRRHARLAAAGIVVLHFSPRQIRSEPDLVAHHIAQALKAGRPAIGITARRAA